MLLYCPQRHESQKGGIFGRIMRICGMVSSGLGRAHVFMAQKHYQEQFQELMGTSVWPGTLNLKLTNDNLVNYIALRMKSGIDTLDADDSLIQIAKNIDMKNIHAFRIRGFLRDGISFGGANAFKAIFHCDDKTTECSVLIPDLTRHNDVIEIISPKFLREHFSLSDGDKITIELL